MNNNFKLKSTHCQVEWFIFLTVEKHVEKLWVTASQIIDYIIHNLPKAIVFPVYPSLLSQATHENIVLTFFELFLNFRK